MKVPSTYQRFLEDLDDGGTRAPFTGFELMICQSRIGITPETERKALAAYTNENIMARCFVNRDAEEV